MLFCFFYNSGSAAKMFWQQKLVLLKRMSFSNFQLSKSSEENTLQRWKNISFHVCPMFVSMWHTQTNFLCAILKRFFYPKQEFSPVSCNLCSQRPIGQGMK